MYVFDRHMKVVPISFRDMPKTALKTPSGPLAQVNKKKTQMKFRERPFMKWFVSRSLSRACQPNAGLRLPCQKNYLLALIAALTCKLMVKKPFP